MASKQFSLKGDSEFSNRVNDTFKDLLEPSSKIRENRQNSPEMRRPRTPPSPRHRSRYVPRHHSTRRAPGWKADPSKYTKYDLSDVEVSSDRGNARAAFSFLREVRKRASEKSPPPPDLDSAKFSFKKPRVKEDLQPKKEEQPSCHSSKRVLPEAHVGERISRKKSLSTSNTKKNSSTLTSGLTLSHLLDEEEENDE